MRKVTVFEHQRTEDGMRTEKVTLGIGVFHGWGVDYEDFESGAGNYSTAIVEMEDGTIQNPHVEMIQFEDMKVQLPELYPSTDDETSDDVVEIECEHIWIRDPNGEFGEFGTKCTKCGETLPF